MNRVAGATGDSEAAPEPLPSPEQMRTWARWVLDHIPEASALAAPGLLPDPHRLLMTGLPVGQGPYDRYQLSVQDVGLVLAAGTWPYDPDRIRALCRAYHEAIDEAASVRGVM